MPTPPPPWQAERRVDPALARRLVRAQAPGVAARTVALLGEGWDNTVYLVDGELVFRFPRRQFGADVVATEIAVLEAVAGRLPLAVPEPRFRGAPTPEFPWPFAGYTYLAGRTACGAALDDAQRAALAASLGRFLAALHATPVAGLDLPGDRLGRMDVERRLPFARERLAALVAAGLVADAAPWAPLLEDLPRGPRPKCLVHGDFYVRHLIVDPHGAPAGVIDWGDTHVGDPAGDLMIAASLLPPAARAEFEAAYGDIDEASWRLARFRALWHGASVALYANAIGAHDLLQEALSGLHRLL